MIYDHIVKINGKYYAAGVDIPDAPTADIPESTDDVKQEETADTPKRGRPKKSQ